MILRTLSRPSRRLLCLLLASALAGCATPIETTRPALDLPERWAEAAFANADNRAVEAAWWRGFGSDELTSLIAEAQAGSPDLRIAAERVRQAELAARLAGSSLYPQLSVGADTSAAYAGSKGRDGVGTQRTSASVGISYEIDLWGRVAAVNEGARAALRGSRYDLEAARLSLTTGVAQAYFQVLATRIRLDVARRNLAIAEKLMSIVEARYQNGVASELDRSRQRSTVLAQRATVLPLEVQERQSLSALALLLGRPPQGMGVAAVDFAGVQVPAPSTVLPADLLTRRPDIASSEAALDAADADVAAARAALLPTVSLSGAAGFASDSLLKLANPAYSVEIAASILRSLFEADRGRNQVAVSESVRRQLVEAYRRDTYTALKEVDDALANVGRYREQEAVQQVIRDEAQRTLRLSEVQLREGVETLSNLLDAQRTLFSADDQLAQLRQARLVAALDLFKALGGGWTLPEESRSAARPGSP
jgi:outer membrane protein, multidrug efflux system